MLLGDSGASLASRQGLALRGRWRTVIEVHDQITESRPQRFRRYPAYEDSGVEWLGKVPAHWSLKRLKNAVARLESGGTPESGNLAYWTDEEDGIPWVAISDMTRSFRVRVTAKRITEEGRRSKRLRILPAGTLLYSMYASLGRVALLETQGVMNQAILGVVPRESEVLRDYLRWWFEFMQAHVQMLSASNTQDNLSAARVHNMPVVLPIAVEEQRAIAGFLDREMAKIDALVDRKERLIDLLREKRTALITRAVTRGLDPNVPMKDSGVDWLGDIPAHWEVKRLKHLTPGTTVGIVVTPSKYYVDEGVPCLRSLNVSGGAIDMENIVFISESANELHRKSKISCGDVVVVRTGQAGTAAVIPEALDGANCIDLLIVRRSERVLSQFVYYYLNSCTAMSQATEQSVGAIQAHYNTSTLARLVVPEIPLDEQIRIVRYLDQATREIDALIAKVRQAIDLLKEFRTALISAAVTGKIDIREEAA